MLCTAAVLLAGCGKLEGDSSLTDGSSRHDRLTTAAETSVTAGSSAAGGTSRSVLGTRSSPVTSVSTTASSVNEDGGGKTVSSSATTAGGPEGSGRAAEKAEVTDRPADAADVSKSAAGSSAESRSSQTAPAQTVPSQTTAAEKTQPPVEQPQEYEEPERFERFGDYQQWAAERGYDSGTLTPGGAEGINQDIYRTLSGSTAYTSGRIVIGDSRCCQLGIYGQRKGHDDFAVFAVWGGHFAGGISPSVPEEVFEEAGRCFEEQILACGSCEIYLFATVNDYDMNGGNDGYISDLLDRAEELAGLSCEIGGEVYRPALHIVGFDGCRAEGGLYGTPSEVFNRYVDSYNEKLRAAAGEREGLSGAAISDVPEIFGGKAEFIDDGLHYSDEVLSAIVGYICQ